MRKICIKMHKYAYSMYKYVQNMQKICRYMQKICTLHNICHYIDFNIANMQIICKKYAKYAQYATKICN